MAFGGLLARLGRYRETRSVVGNLIAATNTALWLPRARWSLLSVPSRSINVSPAPSTRLSLPRSLSCSCIPHFPSLSLSPLYISTKSETAQRAKRFQRIHVYRWYRDSVWRDEGADEGEWKPLMRPCVIRELSRPNEALTYLP